ncbi:hypothetical protein Desgi_1029 [Desulfoscipio gibsoniae DSM 7213]|uniref:Uncharacterized protein n=1 Tax=Desulfoscipio gibsoniae DSM 7213 TaxID=767817 RepID=R4KBL8_9FIRM|nr:hypothetical protein Desgi_1029 [Desulfoscipio gibsoniae DSM 7213]
MGTEKHFVERNSKIHLPATKAGKVPCKPRHVRRAARVVRQRPRLPLEVSVN